MQPICAITFIFDGMFKGMGFTEFLRNLLLLSTLLVFIPSLLIFDTYHFKLAVVWVTFSLWILARGIPLLLKFKRKFSPLVEKK
jgi:Na+-driven multidrug efflux pump